MCYWLGIYDWISCMQFISTSAASLSKIVCAFGVNDSHAKCRNYVYSSCLLHWSKPVSMCSWTLDSKRTLISHLRKVFIVALVDNVRITWTEPDGAYPLAKVHSYVPLSGMGITKPLCHIFLFSQKSKWWPLLNIIFIFNRCHHRLAAVAPVKTDKVTRVTGNFAKAEAIHDDVIKWKPFPRNWPFVRGIHRSSVNFQHKGQWRGALMFSFICVWINDWENNREAGDLRRYGAHYDVIVMNKRSFSKPHPAMLQIMLW